MDRINLAGAVFSFLIMATFAVYSVTLSIHQNVASWIMWTVLNVLTLASAYVAGNKKPWLFVAWTAGSLAMLLSTLANGRWNWGTVEWICVAGSLIAAFFWWKLGAKYAVIACTVSVMIAGIPTLWDTWQHPDSRVWWLWMGLNIGSLCCCIGAKNWTFQERGPHCVSLVFNTLLLILSVQ